MNDEKPVVPPEIDMPLITIRMRGEGPDLHFDASQVSRIIIPLDGKAKLEVTPAEQLWYLANALAAGIMISGSPSNEVTVMHPGSSNTWHAASVPTIKREEKHV